MSSSLVKPAQSESKGREMPSSQPSRASLSQQQQQQQQQDQQRPSGQKPQKLRLSCDACAAAKVKCGKERPRCERCNTNDMNCVYGPSMKHGKPEKKRKQSDPHSSTTSLPSATTSSSHGQFASSIDKNYYNDLHQSYSDLLENIGGSNNFGTYPWNSNNTHSMPGNLFNAPPSEPSFPPLCEGFWPESMASAHRGSGSLSPTKLELNTSLGPLDMSNPMISNLDYSQQYINPDSLNPISSPSSSTSLAGLGGHESISHTRHNSTGAHDCYMIATSTLASLHFRSRSFLDSSDSFSGLYSSSPSVLPTSAPVIQTLDDVLRSNQEAISSVFRLLKCSCAEDPHMAMLYASIIVKVLYWHQVASGTRNPSSRSIPISEGLPSPADSSAGLSSGNSPCSSSAPFISSEPIRIGTYTPDEEDQEPIRRLFLLSNLKKTGRLIEAFATVGEGFDAGTSNLYASLASWLRSELSSIIKEVGNGARASVAA